MCTTWVWHWNLITKYQVQQIDGQVFDKVELIEGSTVTFTASNIYINELKIRKNSTIRFESCANVFINKNVVFERNSVFNAEGNPVRVYVDGNVIVMDGSSVTAQIHAHHNDIIVNGWYKRPTTMNGTFIAKRIHGLINVIWNKYQFSTPCEIQEPVIDDEDTSDECDNNNHYSHNYYNKSAQISSEISPVVELAEVKAYPNPFTDKLNFTFVSPEQTHARIDIYDVTGRKVKTVFEGVVESSVTYNATFTPETQTSAIYLYRLVIGVEVFNGKVIYKKE